MAQLIPNLSSCVGRMTSGEKRFARRLEAALEDDYLCWYDIPVGRKTRYPDFIVLHPSRGLLFLEVKDWRLDNIKTISKSRVELITNNGLLTTLNPVEQVRQCTYQALDILQRDKQLVWNEGNYAGKLKFPYGYGVVLSNITRSNLNKALTEESSHVLPSHLLICKDEMTESCDPEEFQSHLWGMFNFTFREKIGLPEVERLRWLLFPEVRINHGTGDLFGTHSPLDNDFESESMQVSIPDIVRVMDLQQELLARSMGGGHRIIHGVAGSGKTMILGFRCLQLAEILNKPILVLCFNITLAAKLRSFAAKSGIASKVQVYHFHDWCGQQLKLFHCDVIESDQPLWERQVASVVAGVERGRIPRAQYGAVLIDEGHDFEPEWLKLIVQMVDPESDSLLLLYDDAQSIYRKDSGLNFSLSSVGIQARGRTTILKLNYRNSRQILEFAYRFAEEFIGAKDSDDDHIPIISPEAAGTTGPDPVFRQLDNETTEVEYVVHCIRHWLNKGHQLEEIGVLVPTMRLGKCVSLALDARQIPNLCMTDRANKYSYNPSLPRVNILSIHSSKGLEFKTVVLVGINEIHRVGQEKSDQNRLMYVAMTRAREQLLITASSQTSMTDKILEMAAP